MIRTEEQHLAHYGILRRSGRYPWGSGGNEAFRTKRNRDLLDDVAMLRKAGMVDKDIAKGMGMSTTQLRARRQIAIAEQREADRIQVQRYMDHGLSNIAIGKKMNRNESSIRAIRADMEKDNSKSLQTISNLIKDHVDKKKMVQVGSGVEHSLGVSRTKLDTAVAMLKERGYNTYNIKVLQVNTGLYTNMKVLAIPGLSEKDVQVNRGQIKLISGYSKDGGKHFDEVKAPISIDSRRIRINYKEDGGDKADGVIYIRPGVKKLSMGSNRYAQVRIAVDDTHYLKGMAVYKDDMPPGVDLIFNTNKSHTVGKKGVMKDINLDANGKVDAENPFGAIVRQIHGPDGEVTSAMNLVNEQGTWDKFSRNLSSQVLSKQSPDLAKQQLGVSYERRIREFNEINSLTNPVVRKKLLLEFADKTDAASVHLKAAALPKQSIKVLLPLLTIKENEVYAPSIKDGERVALVRFPHGGTFEIPQLTVNNRNREGRRTLGTEASDAVGIHHKVAERLSGADFDGDFVAVIPNNKGSIKRTPALEGLKGFDPQKYKIPKGSPIPIITSSQKGNEMGRISNLITDMTLQGASTEELGRAIRHSMVVIDSEKHELNYKQSAKDHGISALKEHYQGKKQGGASTIISRAGSPAYINQRRERPMSRGGPIDPATGKKVFEDTGYKVPKFKIVTDSTTGKKTRVIVGEPQLKTTKFKLLAVTDNAFNLIKPPGTHIETIYAEHSNRLKALANTARKETIPIKGITASPSAKKVYVNEVDSLLAKLRIAESNAPLEKQAQLLANVRVAQVRQANPGMEPDEVKKARRIALDTSRARVGAGKDKIKITKSEWDAIQAGAISTSKLTDILKNSDAESVKKLALPKEALKMTSSMKSRAKTMLASGFTQIEVADALGVGLTTLKVSISE